MKKLMPLYALAFFLAGCNQSTVTPEVENTEPMNGAETENTPAESPVPSDETADNVTSKDGIYINVEQGFEFRLPENWIIDESRTDANGVVFIDEKGVNGGETREAVNFKENAESLTLDSIVDLFMSERGYTEDMVTRDFSVKVGGEKTVKIKTNEFGLSYYMLLHGNKLFTIDTQDNLFTEETLKSFKFSS